MNHQRQMLMLAIVIGACALAAAGEPYIWWEGERPAKTNFPAKTWFSPASPDEAAVLSGGQWLTNSGKRAAGAEEGYAIYNITVPADGVYHFWTRKFWKHGPFRWRIAGGAWQTCGPNVALADSADIRTHVGANWVYLGDVKLAKGPAEVEIRLLAAEGQELTACFDCFLLTPTVFFPAGKLKPGERSGKADDGYFAYEPSPDAFGGDAMLDLRGLNEPLAGEKGFIKRQGEKLMLAGGGEARFWAVNVGADVIAGDRAGIDYMARRLAKLGVNMVRYHSPLWAGDVAKVDAGKLDNLQYLIAALKKQGIYTTVSFYFPLWLDGRAAGLEGFGGDFKNTKPFGLLYFDPKMQELWRTWVRGLLTSPNPHGPVLAKEPALAVVEVVNEDSLFFWTFSKANIPPVHWQRLEGAYSKWLIARYGSLEKAMAAWGGKPIKEDDIAAGRMALFEAWHMTGQGLARSGQPAGRIADQVRFLAGVQKDWYAAAVGYIRDKCGYGGLTTASNWQTADAAVLDGVERLTYTAADIIDRHGYFGGPHQGEGADWSVRVGHTYQDLSALLQPGRLPVQAAQVAGFPQIVTEIMWPQPNRYRSDMTMLAAAYGSLQGIDGFYFFAIGSPYLRDTAVGKFQVCSPAVAATLPGGALVYRGGMVAQAKPAVVEGVSLEHWPAASKATAAGALDELRKKDTPDKGAKPAKGQAQPTAAELAFYVGPVVRSADSPASAPAVEAARFIDAAPSKVSSSTGQLQWDYGRGLLRMQTPMACGAAGFLAKAGAIDLGEVAMECGNDYAAIMVVAMDGKPLAQSSRMLVQAMTEEQPYGFRAQGGKIVSLGTFPFGIRKIDAKLTLGRPAARATALDENGYATDKRVAISGGVVTLPADAIYVVLERPQNSSVTTSISGSAATNRRP
jgi:hypothetical protein